MKTKLISITVVIFSVIFMACGTNKAANKENTKTIHLTKAEFMQKVTNFKANQNEWDYLGDKPALIDFYASWCGPCRSLAPILEELAQEYEGQIYIYKIDVDAEPELAAAFGIRSIPSLLFAPLNNKPQMVSGALPKAQLKEKIKNTLLDK